MSKCIIYSNKKYESLKISFSKENQIKDILVTLIELQVPIDSTDASNWEFVILELLTNAHRASLEKETSEKITLLLKVDDNYFTTQITDAAGGFDLSALPYDINLPADKIDVFAESFEEYRLKNSYKRFGLGLFSAKKFADSFDIYFVDSIGQRMPEYIPGKTRGTSIVMKKRI